MRRRMHHPIFASMRPLIRAINWNGKESLKSFYVLSRCFENKIKYIFNNFLRKSLETSVFNCWKTIKNVLHLVFYSVMNVTHIRDEISIASLL